LIITTLTKKRLGVFYFSLIRILLFDGKEVGNNCCFDFWFV
jgi:hypothetical protein